MNTLFSLYVPLYEFEDARNLLLLWAPWPSQETEHRDDVNLEAHLRMDPFFFGGIRLTRFRVYRLWGFGFSGPWLKTDHLDKGFGALLWK